MALLQNPVLLFKMFESAFLYFLVSFQLFFFINFNQIRNLLRFWPTGDIIQLKQNKKKERFLQTYMTLGSALVS